MNKDIQRFLQPYQKQDVQEKQNSAPKRPKVSVVIGTYMQESFIRQCIESVLVQKTKFQFEILLGDDGSTDRTKEICEEIALENTKIIRFFSNSRQNQILLNGRETPIFNVTYLIGKARGEYIILTDGDDFWCDENKLQFQVDALDETGADCCQTFFYLLQNDKLTLNAPPYHDEGSERVFMRPHIFHYHHPSTRLMKLETVLWVFHEFGVRGWEDSNIQHILWSRANIVIIKKPTSVYRYNDQGIWSSNSDKQKKKTQIKLYRMRSKWIPEKKHLYGYEKWKNKLILFFPKRIPLKYTKSAARVCNRLENALSIKFLQKKHVSENASHLHFYE